MSALKSPPGHFFDDAFFPENLQIILNGYFDFEKC